MPFISKYFRVVPLTLHHTSALFIIFLELHALVVFHTELTLRNLRTVHVCYGR